MKIKNIRFEILIVIFILEIVGSILMNYLFRIQFFQPISKLTNHIITPTLIVNLIDILVYSILIFAVGKLSFSSIWISKEKIKNSILPIIIIWGTTQISILIYTYFTTKEFVIVQDVSSQIGRILGQLFGNALKEEFVFRGIFFLQLYLIFRNYRSNKFAIIFAMVISQVIFSLMHIPNRIILQSFQGLGTDLLLIFVMGVIITLIFIRTNNLAFAIGGHALINSRINIIETSFPWQITTIVLFVLVAIFWKKITRGNKNNLWKDGAITE